MFFSGEHIWGRERASTPRSRFLKQAFGRSVARRAVRSKGGGGIRHGSPGRADLPGGGAGEDGGARGMSGIPGACSGEGDAGAREDGASCRTHEARTAPWCRKDCGFPGCPGGQEKSAPKCQGVPSGHPGFQPGRLEQPACPGAAGKGPRRDPAAWPGGFPVSPGGRGERRAPQTRQHRRQDTARTGAADAMKGRRHGDGGHGAPENETARMPPPRTSGPFGRKGSGRRNRTPGAARNAPVRERDKRIPTPRSGRRIIA